MTETAGRARDGRRLGFALALAVGLAAPHPARANDPARAEALYQEGRKLLSDGHVPEACARFAESQGLDPATGTLLNLATCHELEGKLATAWAEYREAEVAAHRDLRADREQYARQHVTALEPRLSYLTVVVPGVPAREGRSDVNVKLDGLPLEQPKWGVPAPIDPGAHEISAEAPGHVPFVERITVTTAPRPVTVVVVLAAVVAPAPAVVAPAPAVVAPAPAVVSEPSPAPPAAPTRSPARIAGLVTGAVAVAALAVGTGYGLHAKSKWDARNGECDPTDHCSPAGLTFAHDAESAARVADVAFAVGAASAVAAAILLLRPESASPATASSVRVVPSASSVAASVTLEGTW